MKSRRAFQKRINFTNNFKFTLIIQQTKYLKLKGISQIEKGQQIVDDSVLDSQKYKLVMIGREVSEDDHLLSTQTTGQHILSTDVFHESGEHFSKAIKQDEGVLKHYMRHIYLVVGIIVGVTSMVQLYQYSFQLLPLYEDYLDWVIFQHVKRGRSVHDLGRAFYANDRYSVEHRSN